VDANLGWRKKEAGDVMKILAALTLQNLLHGIYSVNNISSYPRICVFRFVYTIKKLAMFWKRQTTRIVKHENKKRSQYYLNLKKNIEKSRERQTNTKDNLYTPKKELQDLKTLLLVSCSFW